MKKQFTNDEIDKIVKLYTTDGLITSEVAILLGVSKTPILRVLKNKNLLRTGKSNGVKIILTPRQEQLIKEIWGVSEYLLEVHGLPPGRKGNGVTRLIYENLNGLQLTMSK